MYYTELFNKYDLNKQHIAIMVRISKKRTAARVDIRGLIWKLKPKIKSYSIFSQDFVPQEYPILTRRNHYKKRICILKICL